MTYVKKLWDTLVISGDDNNSLITFRLLQLLQNLHKGAIDTSPYDLHQLLINSEFTEQSE